MEPIEEKTEKEKLEQFEDCEYAIESAIRMFYLKYLLITSPELDLVKDFSSPVDYGWFIDALNITLETEFPFFLLEDYYLKNAEEVLYSKRFDYNQLDVYNEVINDTIVKINKLRALSDSEKATGIKKYVSWNKMVRCLPSEINKEDFIRTLAYDAIVLRAAIDGIIPEMPENFITASTNYIAALIPEIYEKYPLAYETTMKFLETETKKRGLHHMYERKAAKVATKKMQYVKRKEE